MSIPPAKGKAPAADEDDSGVHHGFYEHSTGGKVPRAPWPAPKKPSLWRRLLARLGMR